MMGRKICEIPCNTSVDNGRLRSKGKRKTGDGVRGRWSRRTRRTNANNRMLYEASLGLGPRGHWNMKVTNTSANGIKQADAYHRSAVAE
jgi:hypothetical protein